MSKEYVRSVLEMPKESASGLLRMLLLAIAEHANNDGIASPGNKLLAEETTISERQVQRMIPQLADAGILEIVEQGNGRGRTRIMHLLFEPAAITYKRMPNEHTKGDARCHPLPAERATSDVTLYPLNGDVPQKGDIKSDKRVTSDAERVTFEPIKGDMLPEVEADNLTTKPTATNNLVERDQGYTAHACEDNLVAPLSQEKIIPKAEPLVPHKPQFGSNGTSSKPAYAPLKINSPHLDPRRFVNGFIPPGTGGNSVEVFYERNSIREHKLSAPLEDDIAKEVKDLDIWRKVVTAWQQAGYKPTNIAGQLDWYYNGIPAGKDNHGNGYGASASGNTGTYNGRPQPSQSTPNSTRAGGATGGIAAGNGTSPGGTLSEAERKRQFELANTALTAQLINKRIDDAEYQRQYASLRSTFGLSNLPGSRALSPS